ncbi:flagellar biosynthetic protein FliO [Devosia sp.]|uniref:flagellar biosynthetic protein FliO n=1 Tax=Devosia sp. TaxID=1871048 RepID=UPI001AD544AD|nr:flagellar biosynthetic protein FliO [Devosia sp.]MBN9333787.1 flagellar biosynthetic protein FliO [Devosia sp.]
MQFITSLFGGSGNTYLTAAFALGAVIVLTVLGVWLLKLVFRVSTNGVRGRNRRLAIVDSLVVDQKRQLLIVRRDNVEHLILTGGPQDVVVEAGIVPPEPPAAQTTRRPVPMVGRKASNDTRPAETKPAVSPAATVAAGPGAAIDRAREANKSRETPGRSLRHTGLLRPVNAQETTTTGYKPDISPVSEADSAKEDAEKSVNEGVTRDHEAQGESSRG